MLKKRHRTESILTMTKISDNHHSIYLSVCRNKSVIICFYGRKEPYMEEKEILVRAWLVKADKETINKIKDKVAHMMPDMSG